MEEDLFLKLERTGHILTESNSTRVFRDLRIWQEKIYQGPSLHIVVLTKRCNLNCTYCHMNPVSIDTNKSDTDLQAETAEAIIHFALSSPNPNLTFEFQGGEPFLNFRGLMNFVQQARIANENFGKRIRFTVVSNLMVAKDEQIEYCAENGISVSYSLNGPQAIHDHYRISRTGKGSFLSVLSRVRYLREKYPHVISTLPLCVIDEWSATHLEEVIDFFYDEAFAGLSIIPLKPLGNARSKHSVLDYDIYLRCYIRGLNYILDKNGSIFARPFTERMVPYALQKIVGDSNTGLVDWRNPSGDVSGGLTYDFDGEILPVDEARSFRNEFGLGNVKNTTYAQFMRRRDVFRTMNLSLRDREPVCRECAYNPYCGVMPVLDFARTGSATPVPHKSGECLFTQKILDWVYEKAISNPIALFKMAGFTIDELLKMSTVLDAETDSSTDLAK